MTDKAELLARHLADLADLATPLPERRQYGHMGATICDASLQAGLNYRTVVAPRIADILRFWPMATTTRAFLRKADLYGLSRVLKWRDTVKLERILALGGLFESSGVQTEDDLRGFLAVETAADSLVALKGIGPKTLDYLKILAGLPTIAVDRHVWAVVAQVGISCDGYAEARDLLLAAADYLAVDAAALDARIWAAVAR